MRMLLAGALASVVAACASIGRPEGGPRDNTPPAFVRANPSVGQTNVDRTKFELWFDENIKLEDPSNKVVISPVQKNAPSIFANGKHLSVQLRDTLIPNATYTIDFADAVRDLNEGNILDGLAIDFATGDSIDSLRISGMVLQARNLEPAQGMLIGVYSNLSDTAISTLPFERIAKTNQLGQFTIRGLKPGEYRIYAVNDVNRDNHWDRSEDVAFYDVTVSPQALPFQVTDTLAAANGTDSIATRPGVEYLPNDVLLTWFNEGYKSQYLKDYKRTEPNKLRVEFGAKSDSLPELIIANGPNKGRRIADVSVLEPTIGRDTLVYWLRDSAVIAQDSLLISMRYLRTDSTEQLSWTTDTLRFFNPSYKSGKKDDKAKKDDDKKKKDDQAHQDSVPQIPLLPVKMLTSSSHELNLPIHFEVDQPVDSFDISRLRLMQMVDTLWTPVKDMRFYPDSTNIMRFFVDSEWLPSQRYRLEIDSTAIQGIYGIWNGNFNSEFRTKSYEDYGNLSFNITGIPDSIPAFVELLNNSDNLVATAPVVGGEAAFSFLKPATYFARLVIDTNGNGVWDTGNLGLNLQPEEVYYYSKKIVVKQNWDIAQDWDVFALALDQQKPLEVKKNKPKTKDRDRNRPSDDDDGEDEDSFDSYGPGYGGNSWGNGSQYNNSRYNPNMRHDNSNRLAR